MKKLLLCLSPLLLNTFVQTVSADSQVPSEQILQSGIKITAIDSDKSLYEPGSTAVLKTTIVNDNSYDFKGRYKIDRKSVV